MLHKFVHSFLIPILILCTTAAAFSASLPEGQVVQAAQEQSTPLVIVSHNKKHGDILTDSKGMTLYVFNKDAPGASKCKGSCLAAWPPLTTWQGIAPSGGSDVTGVLGTLTRPDGTLQVTINGMPLYYSSKDAKPGETKGQGTDNAWYVVDGSGNPVAESSSLKFAARLDKGRTLNTSTAFLISAPID